MKYVFSLSLFLFNLLHYQMCYNAEDLLPLCEELDIPLVFGTTSILFFSSSVGYSDLRLSPRRVIPFFYPTRRNHQASQYDMGPTRYSPQAAPERATTRRCHSNGTKSALRQMRELATGSA
jgi:hypothetical protein